MKMIMKGLLETSANQIQTDTQTAIMVFEQASQRTRHVKMILIVIPCCSAVQRRSVLKLQLSIKPVQMLINVHLGQNAMMVNV